MGSLSRMLARLLGESSSREKQFAQFVDAIVQLNDDEVTFMLAELDGARQLVDTRRKRGEQAVLFCVTFWTALIGALALIASADNISSSNYTGMVGLMLFVGSAIGHATLMAFVSAVSASSISRSQYLAVRQYFLDRFPATRRYLEKHLDDELLAGWRSSFRPSVVWFLRILAIWNGLCLAVSLGLLTKYLAAAAWPSQAHVAGIVSVITGCILLVLSILAQESLIRRQRRNLEMRFTENLKNAGIGQHAN